MKRRVLIRNPKLVATVGNDPIGNLAIEEIHDARIVKGVARTPHEIAVDLLDVDPFGRCRIETDRLVLSTYAAFLLFDQRWQLAGSDNYNIKRYLSFFVDKQRASLAMIAGVCASDGSSPPYLSVQNAINSMTLGEKGALAALYLHRFHADPPPAVTSCL